MPNFESGVASYITGRAEITVHFPVDKFGRADISCGQCPYYSRNNRLCQLNKHTPAFPEKYVGQGCPLTLADEDFAPEEELTDE